MKYIIIGGGASGLSCAINLKRKGNDVTIIEKNNKLGKKLLITGNGRCNFFNSEFDYTKYYSENKELIKNIINDKTKNIALNFFDSIGLIYSIKEGYYYPYSNQAVTFNNCLINTIKQLGIEIILNAEVKKIERNDKFTIYYNDTFIKADCLVLSTGSKSYPKTGSTGDGYNFLKEFGHSINSIYPALVSLKTNDKILKIANGVRTPILAKLLVNDKEIYSDKGILQINSDSISGICILNLSLKAVKEFENNNDVKIKINFLYNLGIDNNNCFSYLKSIYEKTDKKTICSILEGILNYKLVNYFLDSLVINKEKDLLELSSNEKEKIVKYLTNYTVNITGYDDFNKAQTVTGGLPLKEINTKTMESLKVKGLYVTGELLDIHGICGGYNLGVSFITGLQVANTSDK